jgi:DNA-directed RNA polymerase subunit RPC12/RpoP
MSDSSGEIIVFRYFDSAIEANIAKTKLDAYGIPCFLTEENMANLYPGQSFFAFKIRLHLFKADRERAMQVLTGANLTVQEEGNVKCPRCHSQRLTRGFPKKVADRLTYVFFGVFLPHRKVNQCLDCGFEF